MQYRIGQVLSSEGAVTVIEYQSIEAILQEHKPLARLWLGHCVFLQFQDLLALCLFSVFLDGVFFKAFNLIDAKTNIVTLEVKLPYQQTVRLLYQDIVGKHLSSFYSFIILPEVEFEVKCVIYFGYFLRKDICFRWEVLRLFYEPHFR